MKMLRKRLFSLLSILIIVFGLMIFTGCDIVTGSGETSTFELAYSNFTRLEIATGFDVEISKAEDFYVSITVDKSLYEYLSIGQRGDTLRIGLDPGRTYTAASRTGIVRLPDLRRLELSGGSKAVITGFSATHSLEFELSGASSMILNPTEAGDTSFILSGGSTAGGNIAMNNGSFNLSGESMLELTGIAAAIKVEASGGSNAILDKFPVKSAVIELSGASNAVINVSDLMDIKLSGASNMEYTGSPKLGRLDMSGGSTLNQKEP